MTVRKCHIDSKDLASALLLLEELEEFMTTEVAVQIPNETLYKLVKVLEGSGAIRVFKMNTGFGIDTWFALAL